MTGVSYRLDMRPTEAQNLFGENCIVMRILEGEVSFVLLSDTYLGGFNVYMGMSLEDRGYR